MTSGTVYPRYTVTVSQRPPETPGGVWAATLSAQAKRYAHHEQLCQGTGSTLAMALANMAAGAKRAVR